MEKEVLLMESSEIYLFALVEYTITDDYFDHEFGVEKRVGHEYEIIGYFYRIGDCETGIDVPVKGDSFPKRAVSKFEDMILEDFPTINEFKDNQY